MKILGIDPGQKGAFCWLEEVHCGRFDKMPLKEDKEIDFSAVYSMILKEKPTHIFLERAMPMAMGSKHAFNYGRGFAAIEIAIQMSCIPCTYVEPTKWMKLMLDGVDSRLKPKERSIIAAKRLLPNSLNNITQNKNNKFHDGMVDALLIAAYGERVLGQSLSSKQL